MSIESLKSQIEAFRRRGAGGHDGRITSEDYETLVASLNEITSSAAHELNKSRAEIDAERQSYRNLFRFAEEGYFITDLEGIIHEANAVSCALLGVAENEIVGKALSSYIRIQEQPEFHSHIASLNELKNFHRWETVFVRNPKQELNIIVTVSTIRGYQGNITGLRWLAHDITRHREVEEKLRRNTGQLIESQQLGHVGSWEWDIEHNQLTWSDEMYRIYGLEPQSVKLSYEGFLAFVHPEDQARIRAVVETSFKTRQPFSLEHRIVQPNGTTRHLHAHGVILLDDKSEPARMIGIGQDVTERKLAEEKLRRVNTQLEQMVERRTQELRDVNEQLKSSLAAREDNQESIQELNRELNRRVAELQAVINVLPVGVTVSYDPQGDHVVMNPAGKQIMNPQNVPSAEDGTTPAPRPFKVLRDGQEIPRENRPLRHAMGNKVFVHDAELDISYEDGTLLNLLAYAAPLFDEHGEVRGGVSAFIDITNRKTLEKRLALQYEVVRALAESNEISEASLKVLQVIGENMGWEFGVFWIFDPNANHLYVENIWQKPGTSAKPLADASRELFPSPGKETLPGSVYFSNEPLWLIDYAERPSFPRREAALASGFNSTVSVPLRRGEGEVLGVMEFFSAHIQPPSDDLIDMYNAFASQIGEFMGRKFAESLVTTRMNQQAVITSLSRRALLNNDIQELLHEACAQISRSLSVEFCSILELMPEEQQMLFRAGIGWEENVLRSRLDIEPGSPSLYVLSEHQPIRIVDLSKEHRFQPASLLLEHKITSGMSAVISGHSRSFGLLEVYSIKRRLFTQDDLHFLQGVAHVLAAAIQHQEVRSALRLSRNQLSVILGGISDGITAQAKNGQLIYANDAAARITGYENANELMATTINQITSRFKIFDEYGMLMSLDQLPGGAAMRGEVAQPMTIRFKVLSTGEERWSLVKAQAVKNDLGEAMIVVNIFHDITDLKRAELGQRLLAETSKVMAKELDYETRLSALSNLVVPALADWCAIDLLDDNNILQRVAVAHPDPQMVEWAHELHERYPPDPNSNMGAYKVVRTNQAEYIPVITEQMIDMIPSADARDLIRKLKLSSAIIVPLLARGRALGTLSLIWAESDHYYTAEDLALTEELARRAALALDNARLYTDAQRLNAELEERVLRRTTQIQRTNLRLSQEVDERKLAEEKYRRLSVELDELVSERTRQLENANQKLQREIFEREFADDALRLALQKTRELYHISQTMALVNTPDELLQVLLSSSQLDSAIRASVAIFDPVWQKNGPAPISCTILTAWNRQPETVLYIGQEMSLAEYGLIEPYSRNEPFIITNIQADSRVSATMFKRLTGIGVVGSIIFPLIAGGEWYGLLSLHFAQVVDINTDDIRHLQGLVDEAAMGIHNFILLKTEAQARREAENANKLKLKFLAMVSHELRTPLTSIKGFSTTLLADDVEWKPENQRDFIETINAEADKLSDLIEQLLDLSRLEAGTIRIDPRPVEWSEILSTSMAQLNALTVNHQLIIEESKSELPALHVDVMRVSQVITNLVSNSVKYSSRNTTITISVEKLSDQFIKVSVIDNGMGIPPEFRSRVFEAFQQLEQERRKTQGAGLGLAICRGLIEAHGGRIWVDDHAGEGATFSFTLPIAGNKTG